MAFASGEIRAHAIGRYRGALSQLNVDAKLGEAKGEDRGKSLFGFYCVLFGFLLQMLGSGLMFLALFGGNGSGGRQGGRMNAGR